MNTDKSPKPKQIIAGSTKFFNHLEEKFSSKSVLILLAQISIGYLK